MGHQQLRHRRPRAEPADQRGIGDQEQPGLAQQCLRQVQQRREHFGIKRQQQGHRAADDGVSHDGTAQKQGWMDHDNSPFSGLDLGGWTK
jgi:hypothetical protein